MPIPLSLFLVALAVRVLIGVVAGEPAYPDSFYYVNVAHRLAAGEGLTVDYIWNFVDVGGRLPADPHLPIASNAHWMPLGSLVQVPLLWLFGPGVLAQGLPFWLAGAAVAPVTWWLALDAGVSRSQALAGAALVAVPGGLGPFLAQPDNFALFMLLGALALWACARGITGDRRAFAVGGLAVGLATLSRNDGVLLGVPFALAFLRERWSLLRLPDGWRRTVGLTPRMRGVGAAEAIVRPAIGWRAAVACGLLFALVVAPWYLRQLVVFGSLSPSAANGRILWIADYQALWSISGETTIGTFLAQGPVAIVASRLAGLVDALKVFAITPLMIVLTPFLVVGLWGRRRDAAFAPWMTYGVTLFAFAALLFAVHVAMGTFLHSAVALVPHAYLLVVLGIGDVVRAVARRRRHWDVPRATRHFTAGAVVVAAVFTVAATLRVGVLTWGGETRMRAPIVAALATAPVTDRVMSGDPGAYRYLAGRGGIVTPNDPLPVVEAALRAYGVRWLVLERDTIVPSLEPLLAGRQRPDWLSAPVAEVRAPATAGASATAEPSLPRAALFAVCLEPTDVRCAGGRP